MGKRYLKEESKTSTSEEKQSMKKRIIELLLNILKNYTVLAVTLVSSFSIYVSYCYEKGYANYFMRWEISLDN
jgi:hypothetical protein